MQARQGRPLAPCEAERPTPSATSKVTAAATASRLRQQRVTHVDTEQLRVTTVAKERRRVAEILGTLSGANLIERAQANALSDVLADPTAAAENAVERFTAARAKVPEDNETMGQRIAAEFNRRSTC